MPQRRTGDAQAMAKYATERSLDGATPPVAEVRPVLEMVGISKRFGAT
jgi:hypothetical protein